MALHGVCERTAPASAPSDVLAQAYVATRDPAVRDALVRRCESMVRGIAAEFRGGAQDDDLVQVGFVGLLNAIEHYDASRGTPFALFARHFVRGEIRHYLRDHHNLMRRPRWLERVSGRIEQAVGNHLEAHGRYPGLADLAASLGLDLETLTDILRTRDAVRTLSLDAEDDDGQPKVDPNRATGRPQLALSHPLEDRMVLIDALEKLNPLQRTVVFHIFFTDLTQAETAARIGVSQKHVSRILASALHRLRDILAPGPAVPA
ncbi:MAG: sigma-70 family RNA polymerase sigma factor [Armatimonadota bacterium]|nr:sigma-70 family RNA polymerase sigma factor [Armatimonadota bacterium]